MGKKKPLHPNTVIMKTKNDAEDESEVKALKAALELLTLKHPEV